jgi:hypothetical protein
MNFNLEINHKISNKHHQRQNILSTRSSNSAAQEADMASKDVAIQRHPDLILALGNQDSDRIAHDDSSNMDLVIFLIVACACKLRF